MQYLSDNVRLVLCGEGDQLSACKSLAEKLGVQTHVFFPGQVIEIAPWYRMADALVTSSRSEGLPFNVMEAMHCGLPVVASAVKGHIDLIEGRKTGLLYPYGDASIIAECVQKLQNTGYYDALAEKEQEFSKEFSLSTVLPYVFNFYVK